MIKSIKTLFIVTSITALSACGWHFQNGTLIPQELRTLTFESPDPYSEMSVAMRNQLQANDWLVILLFKMRLFLMLVIFNLLLHLKLIRGKLL